MSTLGNKNDVANIAVKDLEISKRFHEDILSLTRVEDEGQEAIVFKSRNSTVIVIRIIKARNVITVRDLQQT
jgi:hypothetical protein